MIISKYFVITFSRNITTSQLRFFVLSQRNGLVTSAYPYIAKSCFHYPDFTIIFS
nr:MAG TPA: hypothetical protein [Caudoviricetes sp.]